MLIFGVAVGVPTLKKLCNSDCPGSCLYSGFDLNCNCQVPLNLTNFQCGDIDYCINASDNVWNTTTITRQCDCQTNFYDSKVSCNIAACPQGYSGNSTSTTCTDINECEIGFCGSNASCSNTPGSFTCTCDEGFYLVNGHICMNTSVLVLSTGYNYRKNPSMVISYKGWIHPHWNLVPIIFLKMTIEKPHLNMEATPKSVIHVRSNTKTIFMSSADGILKIR